MKKNYINEIYENYYYKLNYLENRIKNTLKTEWVSRIFKLNHRDYYYRKKKRNLNKLYTNLYFIQIYTKSYNESKWSLKSIVNKQLSIKINNEHKQIKILSRLTSNRKNYIKHFQSFSLEGYNIITEKVLKTKHMKRSNFFNEVQKFNNNVITSK